MKNKPNLPIPVQKALRILGKDINNARRRRRISMELMSKRAGFSLITLSRIEKGSSSVSIGSYASALFVLGMIDHLEKLANASRDIVGHQLEEENLPKRIRSSKKNEGETDE